jgi:phage-related protein
LNLFELFVKIGVDDQASNKLKNISGKLGDGLKTAAKVGVAAVGAASTAIVALTTQAVNSFAEYEQLAGGAQKIFNDMDFSKIAADANNAYKELGLSANQYLAVINDVGATFAATMGDEAGYEAAKTGLKAISDYASGTGKNVDELSQKFTLITRSTSSYQSIADQFSGILPATSAGFLEQAQAAGILSDSYKQLTEVPIDEYQSAVSQMLEQGVKDLGLYNNTMDEAFSTLSGSLTMAKSAWSNLVTGIADEQADIDTLMGNFINSVKAVTKQIAPVVGTALNGIGKLIKEVVPVAMQYIPQIIGEFLPTIGEAAIGIVTSIGTAIFDNIDQILEWGQQMLDTLLDGINSNTGNIASVVSQILTTFGSFILENLPEIIMAGLNILVALVSGIVEAIPELATAATKAIIELAAYLISAENLEKIISLGADLINALSEGIENVVAELVSVGEEVVENIKSGINSAWSGLVSWFNGIWNSLFGNRTVSVSVKTSHSGVGGGFANGLSYVPYDGFPAILHEGERVLTAEENKAYNRGATGNTSGITIIQNIQTVPQTPVEFAAATEAYFEQARWAFA